MVRQGFAVHRHGHSAVFLLLAILGVGRLPDLRHPYRAVPCARHRTDGEGPGESWLEAWRGGAAVVHRGDRRRMRAAAAVRQHVHSAGDRLVLRSAGYVRADEAVHHAAVLVRAAGDRQSWPRDPEEHPVLVGFRLRRSGAAHRFRRIRRVHRRYYGDHGHLLYFRCRPEAAPFRMPVVCPVRAASHPYRLDGSAGSDLVLPVLPHGSRRAQRRLYRSW